MTDQIPEWLARLQPGDKVILEPGRLSGHHECVVPIKRVTATQIVVASPFQRDWDLRFRKANGLEVGGRGTWSPRDRITEPTPERLAVVREAMRRRKLIAEIRQTSWKDQPTSVLEAVARALDTADEPIIQ